MNRTLTVALATAGTGAALVGGLHATGYATEYFFDKQLREMADAEIHEQIAAVVAGIIILSIVFNVAGTAVYKVSQ